MGCVYPTVVPGMSLISRGVKADWGYQGFYTDSKIVDIGKYYGRKKKKKKKKKRHRIQDEQNQKR